MKNLRLFAALAVLTAAAFPVVAHHAAEGIVDEEIYAMIDAMVADTPHADLDFSDMGGGTMQIDIITPVPDLEALVADGLLRYVSLLDGDVTLTVEFTDRRNVNVTILQVEGPEQSAKAGGDDAASFGDVKASYR